MLSAARILQVVVELKKHMSVFAGEEIDLNLPIGNFAVNVDTVTYHSDTSKGGWLGTCMAGWIWLVGWLGRWLCGAN